MAKGARATSSVCPSAGWRATCAVPICVAAPGRFSTTKGWRSPKRRAKPSAGIRAAMSAVPLGATPTTIATCRDG